MKKIPSIMLLSLFSCGFSLFLNCKNADFEADKILTPVTLQNEAPQASDKQLVNFLPKLATNQIVRHSGFTLSYNEKYEVADWVAYELNKKQLRNADYKRPFFISDPAVITGSADWRNYKKSGFDKGHLCPAADREYSKEAFEETFFTSNIAPQRHDFNSGVWNRLEQKVRYWAAKYERIYVVTGGVLTNNMQTIGKEKVAVPNYFYKVLLHQEKGETKMIGFLVPHHESNKALYEFVVAVDQIEKMTGIDFFHELNDALENKLEQSSDYKSWSF